MKTNNRSFEQDSEVDMTPMLDIVFIKLIFFIVTTSFIKESGLVINRPAEQPIDDREVKQAISIKINSLQDVVFDSRLIQPDAVLANVQAAISQNPELIISVQVAEKADTGLLVSVVDQVKQAGLEKVTVSQSKEL